MKTVSPWDKKPIKRCDEDEFDYDMRLADWYFGKAEWIGKYVQIPLAVIMAICMIGIIVCLVLR